MWSVNFDNETFTGLECQFIPTCQYCGEQLECITVKPLRFPLLWPEGIREGFAIDVDVKCPVCHDTEVFGVAVTKEHYEKIFNKSQRKEKTGMETVEGRGGSQASEMAEGQATL